MPSKETDTDMDLPSSIPISEDMVTIPGLIPDCLEG